MPIMLQNRNLVIRIECAGERYTGSRFDWNGTVVSARFCGIETLGEEKPPFRRNDRIYGRGLHNEFGIHTPVGWDDCREGEWFPKIGTGWLRKDAKPYFFYTQYDLERLEFSCSTERETTAIFTARSGERNGYSYTYTKTYTLEEDFLDCRYELSNTGSKQIATDEYVHNFLCIAGQRTGPQVSLEFPWKIESSGSVAIHHSQNESLSSIVFLGNVKEQFHFGGLLTGSTDEAISTGDVTATDEATSTRASWTLREKTTGISVSEKDSFVPSEAAVWGWKRVISPEIFYSFSVAPGEKITWERTWNFARSRR